MLIWLKLLEKPGFVLVLSVGVEVVISDLCPLTTVLAKPNQTIQNFTFKVQKGFILICQWCDTDFLTCSSLCKPQTIFLTFMLYINHEHCTLQLLY